MSDETFTFPDHDYPDDTITLPTTGNSASIRDEPHLSVNGPYLSWRGVEYIAMTEYEAQATKTARQLAQLLALESFLRREISAALADSVSVHQELLTERELRTNTQNKCSDARMEIFELARRIVECDATSTSDDWTRLVEVAKGIVKPKVPTDAQDGL